MIAAHRFRTAYIRLLAVLYLTLAVLVLFTLPHTMVSALVWNGMCVLTGFAFGTAIATIRHDMDHVAGTRVSS